MWIHILVFFLEICFQKPNSYTGSLSKLDVRHRNNLLHSEEPEKPVVCDSVVSRTVMISNPPWEGKLFLFIFQGQN